MDRLTATTSLPPFGMVALEASSGSQDWQVGIFVSGPDRRYSLGYVVLSKGDMLKVIDSVMSAIEAAVDPSTFNVVAVRERSLGNFGGLGLKAHFHPDGALAIEASAASSKGRMSKLIKNAEQFVRHLRHVIAIGDQMVA